MTLNLSSRRGLRAHGISKDNIFPDGVKRKRKPRIMHDDEATDVPSSRIDRKRSKGSQKKKESLPPPVDVAAKDLYRVLTSGNIPPRIRILSNHECTSRNPEWDEAFDQVMISMKQQKQHVQIVDVIKEVTRLRTMQISNPELKSLSLLQIHQRNLQRIEEDKQRLKDNRRRLFEKVKMLRRKRRDLVFSALNFVQSCKAAPIDHIKTVPYPNICALRQDLVTLPKTMQVALLSYVINGTTNILGVDGPVSVAVDLGQLSVPQFAFVELFVRLVLDGRIPSCETLDKQIADTLSQLADIIDLIKSQRR